MTNNVKLHKGQSRSPCRLVFPVLALAFLLMLILAGCGRHKPMPSGAPHVEVTPVIQRDVPVYHQWVGTTDGIVNATIRAQVQGYLIKRNYWEGDFVKKGQLLFEIDPRPFEAALDQAKGNLGMSEASWQRAKANLARVKPLAAENAVSQKDLDDATANEQSTRAQVQANQAAAEKARLELGFTKIVSLIDGIAGIAKAQVGDLVGPNQVQELTTVSKVDPIKVYISVSEQEYLYAAERGHKGTDKIVLEMVLADGSTYPHKGEFILADRQVDVKTGTITVGAIFKNPRNILRPGQFARIKALIHTKKGALLVPQRAVSELQGSYQVSVVGPDNKVDIRPVKVSERVETLWVVDEGLKPGEKVVVEGLQKVRQGMTVVAEPFGAQNKAMPNAPSKPGSNPSKPAPKGS